jgi:uncharacterized protein YicC (UPF0701 family)
MSVTSKHLATFILGAAAGVALNKYLQTEEGEKLMEELKTKGNELKDDAEAAMEKAPAYFEELKTGASTKISEVVENLKDQFPEAEKMITDLFSSLIKPKATINIDPDKAA